MHDQFLFSYSLSVSFFLFCVALLCTFLRIFPYYSRFFHNNKLQHEPGRSSASNSDVDSESDDVSLDDSASDRSDGSDSGSGSAHHEPFTAARVMALNRKQQQQQRSQQARSGDFRPPTETEYQSGDSIDSMLAEDSGGSDSSSSDLAD